MGHYKATYNIYYWNHRLQERDGAVEKIFKSIMVENFSNLINTINLEIQDVQRIPSRRNRENQAGKITLKDIIIKLLKISDEDKK